MEIIVLTGKKEKIDNKCSKTLSFQDMNEECQVEIENRSYVGDERFKSGRRAVRDNGLKAIFGGKGPRGTCRFVGQGSPLVYHRPSIPAKVYWSGVALGVPLNAGSCYTANTFCRAPSLPSKGVDGMCSGYLNNVRNKEKDICG